MLFDRCWINHGHLKVEIRVFTLANFPSMLNRNLRFGLNYLSDLFWQCLDWLWFEQTSVPMAKLSQISAISVIDKCSIFAISSIGIFERKFETSSDGISRNIFVIGFFKSD